MKYRVLGKEKVLALGAYDAVSLADARELRDAARKQLAKGNDPMVLRKADKVANWVASKNSFESVAVFGGHTGGLRAANNTRGRSCGSLRPMCFHILARSLSIQPRLPMA